MNQEEKIPAPLPKGQSKGWRKYWLIAGLLAVALIVTLIAPGLIDRQSVKPQPSASKTQTATPTPTATSWPVYSPKVVAGIGYQPYSFLFLEQAIFDFDVNNMSKPVDWPAAFRSLAAQEIDALAVNWYKKYFVPLFKDGGKRLEVSEVDPLLVAGSALPSDSVFRPEPPIVYKVFNANGKRISPDTPGDGLGSYTSGFYGPFTIALDDLLLMKYRTGFCNLSGLPEQISSAAELPCGFSMPTVEEYLQTFLIRIQRLESGEAAEGFFADIKFDPAPFTSQLYDCTKKRMLDDETWAAAPLRYENGWWVGDADYRAKVGSYRVKAKDKIGSLWYELDIDPKKRSTVLTWYYPRLQDYFAAYQAGDTAVFEPFRRLLDGRSHFFTCGANSYSNGTQTNPEWGDKRSDWGAYFQLMNPQYFRQ